MAEFFAGHPEGLARFEEVRSILGDVGPVEVRVSRSQVALRRRRGFAYLWLPGRWLSRPSAEVVLSIALPERLGSPRFKEVVNPRPGIWMHHLELRPGVPLDDEVATWLLAGYEAAA